MPGSRSILRPVAVVLVVLVGSLAADEAPAGRVSARLEELCEQFAQR